MPTIQPGESHCLQRPSLKQSFISPVVLLVFVSTLLLQVSFFLPYAAGPQRLESGEPMQPGRLAIEVFFGHASTRPMQALTLLWVYLYSWILVATLLMLAWRRPQWFDKALLAIPAVGIAGLSVLWWLLLFSGASGSRAAMGIAVVVMPLGACMISRSLWLLQSRQALAAACWGHSLLCILAVFALRWCWYPPLGSPGVGCVVGIVGALGLMVASWLWPLRGAFDLFDRSLSPRAPQTTIWRLGIATALAAVGLVYWRAVGLWQSAGG